MALTAGSWLGPAEDQLGERALASGLLVQDEDDDEDDEDEDDEKDDDYPPPGWSD